MIFPDWKLERYLLGELSPKEMENIRKREQSEDILRERLNKLKRENDEILSLYPPETVVPQIETRFPRIKKNVPVKHHWPIWAAAMLVVAFIQGIPFIIDEFQSSQNIEMFGNGDDETRIKGLTPRLEVWRRRGYEAEPLKNNTSAFAGDEIQLRYAVPESCYGILVSLDGKGTLTAHLPEGRFKAEVLEPGKMTFLDKAYRLDDAPEFETFYLITSPKPFEVNSKEFESLLKQKEVFTTQITLKKGPNPEKI